ncbi:MAG: PVC-type heme-binding CxxCH protein [Verrucomicrobiota bacterium]
MVSHNRVYVQKYVALWSRYLLFDKSVFRRMRFLVTFLFCVGLSVLASADDFPEVYNSEADPNAHPPSPEEAAASFDLPEGFEISVFAAEPDLRNPIAMAWDQKGRIWVAENYTYAEKARRFDLGLRDRVLIFEDEDWDGRADRRTVFYDNLQMLTSVEVGRGGTWVMCPPQLLFIPDADGDDVPDGNPIVKLDGFDVAQNNYHNFANGLRWGPDGWLYGRCGHSCPGRIGVPGTPDEERIPIKGGIWRYHPDREVVEVLTHGTVNPWGHDWDENGELFFINTVIGHLWHMIPGAHFREGFGQSPNKLVFDRLSMHADHWHFDTSASWTKSRDGAANDFGGGHAHIGMMIYQGENLPGNFQNRLLTWNMHGRRANVERLDRVGTGYVGRHEPDQFLAGDTWFRGMEISQGPDGALYAIDWSDTGECHEHTGVHRESGRLYRISQGTPAKPQFEDLSRITADGVKRILANPNVWYDRQLRIALAGDPTEEKTLAKIYSEETGHLRLRATWHLKALGSTPADGWAAMAQSSNEHDRAWAIRLRTDHLPLDGYMGPINEERPPVQATFLRELEELAKTDRSGLVRLTLASTLQRLPLSQRLDLAKALASRNEDSEDHNQPAMVWYGVYPLATTAPEDLVELARSTRWPQLQQWISRALASQIEQSPDALDALLSWSATEPDSVGPILAGLQDAFDGWRKAPAPGSWATVSESLAASNEHRDAIRELSVLFGSGRAMDDLKAIARDTEANLESRQNALRALIESRADGLRELCEELLNTRILNQTAVEGLALFDDPEIGQRLAENYRRFWPKERPSVIAVLTSRPAWALALLSQIESGKIPRTDLSPFHARQIVTLGNEQATATLARVWGEVRQSDAAKRERIETLKVQLSADQLVGDDLSAGRAYYRSLCGNCHQLYDEGGQLGPNLTGSGRAELEYLLENVIDPSAVVSADYRMTTLTLNDGRTLAGVVAGENDRTVTVRLLTDETTIEKSEVTSRETQPVSIMPEGLFDALSPEQLRDLVAYLQHPRQVPLP